MKSFRFVMPALALAATLLLTAAPVFAATGAVEWVHDDYAKAVRIARERKVPLFVDIWAPWCHTCRSMWAYVLNEPSLSRHAGQFVFLSVDTEKPANASFRGRFPADALPSFYVMDPVAERISVRWVGGMTIAQLHALLDDAAIGGRAPRALVRSIARADSLYADNQHAAAAAAFGEVLATAPEGWPGYSRAVESRMYALSRSDGWAEGVALARAALPRLGRSPSALVVASSALACARELPAGDTGKAGAVAELEAATRSLVSDFSFSTAADDRSGAWIEILTTRQEAGDSVGARASARAWSEFLDAEAAKAGSPEQRAVFDPHRLSAYLELGEADRAVPMLQQSERDLPGDYNPSQRLATAYKALRKWDEALAASDRAMALAYGPRKMLLYTTRADIFAGKQDLAAERRTVEEGIAFGQALPESQRPARALEAMRKRLEKLATP